MAGLTTQCAHKEAADPRQAGICVKCSKPIPRRDLIAERELLIEARDICRAAFGHEPVRFAHHVSERLEAGARKHGDGDFHGRDCFLEALSKPLDCAAYMMLDYHRRLPALGEAESLMLRQTTLAGIAASMRLYAELLYLRANDPFAP